MDKISYIADDYQLPKVKYKKVLSGRDGSVGKSILLCMHKDLGLDPLNQCKRSVHQQCIPVAPAFVGMKTGGSQRLAGCQPSRRFSERPCLKGRRWRVVELSSSGL